MLKALNGKAIICVKKQNKTESGFMYEGNSEKDTLVGSIYSISEYYDKEGKIGNAMLKEGDTILISKYAGNKIEYEKEEYVIIDIDNILAKVEEDS